MSLVDRRKLTGWHIPPVEEPRCATAATTELWGYPVKTTRNTKTPPIWLGNLSINEFYALKHLYFVILAEIQ